MKTQRAPIQKKSGKSFPGGSKMAPQMRPVGPFGGPMAANLMIFRVLKTNSKKVMKKVTRVMKKVMRAILKAAPGLPLREPKKPAEWQPADLQDLQGAQIGKRHTCSGPRTLHWCPVGMVADMGGRVYPHRRISSLRTLRGLGQRSWVVVVPRPWTVPPPLGIPNKFVKR